MGRFIRAHEWVVVPTIFFLFGCSPPKVTRTSTERGETTPRSIAWEDSLQYRIVFADKDVRDRFAGTLNRFCTEQNLSLEHHDSAGRKVFRIAAAGNGGTRLSQGSPATASMGKSVTPFNVNSSAVADSGHCPTEGGSLRLYYPRSTLEYPFSGLLDKYPFSKKIGPDSLQSCFDVQGVTPLSITLKMSGKIINADGKALNPLDIVDQWTRYIRDHPAEGLSLFRSCDGIMDFISGREAIVRGLLPIDNTTIRIKLGNPDTQALERLRTGRAMPPSLRIGSYALKTVRENEDTLASNFRTAGTHPFVNFAVIKRGGDGNPLLSFSLGHYDAVALWSAPDLDYARRTFLKNGATCSPIGSDRYFIVCRLPDLSERAFIRSLIAPFSLLKDAVKAEGAPIAAVGNDSLTSPAPSAPMDAQHFSTMLSPIKIWYRADDAISKIIADKLLAACVGAGVSGKVIPMELRDYESMLVSGGEGCVVAWVGEAVLTCRSEQLRLAAMFFNDTTDESVWLSENREVPLFSISWSLLATAKVGLWNGKISGMFVKLDSNEKRER
jgi:hypothetical protein